MISRRKACWMLDNWLEDLLKPARFTHIVCNWFVKSISTSLSNEMYIFKKETEKEFKGQFKIHLIPYLPLELVQLVKCNRTWFPFKSLRGGGVLFIAINPKCYRIFSLFSVKSKWWKYLGKSGWKNSGSLAEWPLYLHV